MGGERLSGLKISQTETDLVLEARKFAQGLVRESFYQRAVEMADAEPKVFPREFLQKVATHGLTAMEIDDRYLPDSLKGARIPVEAQVVVMEELAREHAGLALSILVLNSLTAYEINRFGTEEQKERLLPAMGEGKIFACFGLTEPDVGSDAKNIQLPAKWDEHAGVYNVAVGAKRFITGASGADLMLLAARTGAPESRDEGITVFLLDMKTPGIKVREYSKPGQSGSQLCEVYFDNVNIPKEAILGGSQNLNKGWGIIDATLKHSRNSIAAQGVGIAQKAYDEAVNYGQIRQVHGRPLVSLPDHAKALRIMDTQIDIARRLTQLAAEKESSGDESFWVLSSLSKLVACDTAAWAALESMQLHGGIGYTSEMKICRLWLDSPVLRIYEGTVPIQIKLVRSGGIGNSVIRQLLPPKISESYVAEEDDLVHPDQIDIALQQFDFLNHEPYNYRVP